MTDPASAGSQQPPASGDYQHAPAAEARWQALKDYATELKESASRYAEDSGYPAPVAIGMEAQAEVLGAVLAKMDELEARDV